MLRRFAELSTGLYTGRTTHSGLHRDARALAHSRNGGPNELPREELVLVLFREGPCRADRRAVGKYIRPGVPDLRLPKHAVAVAGDRDGRETSDHVASRRPRLLPPPRRDLQVAARPLQVR